MASVRSVSTTRRQRTNSSNDNIEEQIKRDGLAAKREVKALLLGTGRSNTARFLKSMQLVHGGGYDDAERKGFRKDILSTTVKALQNILNPETHEHLDLQPSNEARRTTILALPDKLDNDILSPETVDAMQNLCQDPAIQASLDDPQSTNLIGASSIHYLKSIDRITKEDYLPTDDDILNCQIKPSGIAEVSFKVDDLTYRIVHMGRQDGAWRKWLHCFEGVRAIVFLVGLDEYDQWTVTDGDGEQSVNCIHEALDVFDLICNSKWFEKTSIILFLDDKNLTKKLSEHPLENFFPDYTGGKNTDAAREYMLKRFVSLDKQDSATRQIHANFTNSNDTKRVEHMLTTMQEILLNLHTGQK
ncbi:hypothetical protein AGABI2DRAFT_151207 [Agaricus bisporus var. bisporus H97]|uniref:hypothetical protein n=1 Tax=Agaricus bisporus var. bisporus (strain H97 / ATCC MYA-4626 / FGSC 10389) TaxID=936046 RepID=UPI00029F6C2F|nr:hypothetical protein AGABI2DRAFT_151207 [Agaricus bisporus var. bisporus H97]EKV47809.1 hypothetical protein AGABI2DRAFT_151207 [Agaricus bisporus var. bisporus H97]